MLFLFANGSTVDAFAPAPNKSVFARSCKDSSEAIARTANSNVINGRVSKTSRRNKTSLSALPLFQLASQAFTSCPLSTILTANPDAEAEVLTDISHLFLDFTAFFKFEDKFLNYAQLIGRISFILIDFLPGHAFHMEEMAIQLFFLWINIQRILPYFDETDKQEATSSGSISQDEIELQQQLHSRPLLSEEHIDYNHVSNEVEEITVASWEAIELEMNEGQSVNN